MFKALLLTGLLGLACDASALRRGKRQGSKSCCIPANTAIVETFKIVDQDLTSGAQDIYMYEVKLTVWDGTRRYSNFRSKSGSKDEILAITNGQYVTRQYKYDESNGCFVDFVIPPDNYWAAGECFEFYSLNKMPAPASDGLVTFGYTYQGYNVLQGTFRVVDNGCIPISQSENTTRYGTIQLKTFDFQVLPFEDYANKLEVPNNIC